MLTDADRVGGVKALLLSANFLKNIENIVHFNIIEGISILVYRALCLVLANFGTSIQNLC